MAFDRSYSSIRVQSMLKKKNQLTRKAKGFKSLLPSKAGITQNFTIKDAKQLIAQGRWQDARRVLEQLSHRSPQRLEIWVDLWQVCQELGDWIGVEQACDRLVELNPEEVAYKLALASAYTKNTRPLLAVQLFQYILDHHPDHAQIKEVQSALTGLEAAIVEMLDSMGVSGEDAREIALLHEHLLSKLQQGDLSATREIGEVLLTRRPDFVPALNNLSSVEFLEGCFDRAIARAEKVLEIDPNNFHALGNLVRCLYISAQPAAARKYADRLQAITSTIPESYIKKAEAFAYLGDDEAILNVFNAAQEANIEDAILYHYAGVASLRLKQEKQAKQYWQKAIRLMPSLAVAQGNLADLDKPIGDRHAPFAFGLPEWWPQHLIQPLLDILIAQASAPDETSAEPIRAYLEGQPMLQHLIPTLLERGDATSRGLAFHLARVIKTPTTLQYVYDFAFSQAGPDQMRHEAAIVAQANGLITENLVKLWIQGQWKELYLMNFEISNEPTSVFPPKIKKLYTQAHSFLGKNDGVKAEALLQQALEIDPDEPAVLNNLAMAYSLQGRLEEAQTLIKEIHAKHPDYIFACLSLAKGYIQDGELEAAEKLLKPMQSRQKFHISEFSAFCETQIFLLLARDNGLGAKAWFDMWAQISPEDPKLQSWRVKLAHVKG